MNRLTTAKRAAVIGALVEGTSVRATQRMTGVSVPTILKLLADLGRACSAYQERTLVNLQSKRIQADELHSFCYARRQNLPKEKKGEFGYGDVWTWVALDADTKLVITWFVGNRDGQSAHFFMQDLAPRLANRVQLTTDGLAAYIKAVDEAFGADVDFARLVKVYASDPQSEKGKYAPPVCIACKREAVTGDPDEGAISTSYVERMNLQIRMSTKRFARLTNAHSKKLENHCHALAIQFMYYNFVRVHQTLKTTPAVASGVAERPWTMAEMIGLLETEEAKRAA